MNGFYNDEDDDDDIDEVEIDLSNLDPNSLFLNSNDQHHHRRHHDACFSSRLTDLTNILQVIPLLLLLLFYF